LTKKRVFGVIMLKQRFFKALEKTLLIMILSILIEKETK